MKAKLAVGFSLIELLVVISIVGVVIAFSIPSTKQPLKIEQLVAEIRKGQSIVMMLLVEARESQTSMKLSCANSTLNVDRFVTTRSNDYKLRSSINSLNVKQVIAGKSKKSSEMAFSSVVLSCDTAYITSDGNLFKEDFSEDGVAFTLTLKSNTTKVAMKTDFSVLGVPRIYSTKDADAENVLWSEIFIE